MALRDRVKKLWNAFTYNDKAAPGEYVYVPGPSHASRPDRPRLSYTNERSIISSIYTRVSMDIAQLDFRHVKIDDQGRYASDVDSELNLCFDLEANIDQSPRAFIQDIVLTLFDHGTAAVVPVDTIVDPIKHERFDVRTLRVGTINQWYPRHVRINVYNAKIAERQDITLEKRIVAIVENPLYAVMNEPNSTLSRLTRKLSLLDAVDEQSGSGKLDIIVQLPYVIKSEALANKAEQRRSEIEMQLRGSQYGIAYTDGAEKITQLNRPAENNLLKQVEYLTNMLYGQLGLTEAVMNGTATEPEQLNYINRTVEPIATAIVQAMNRAFLGRPGMRARERIMFFRDPFQLVPISDIAEIADKLKRNEVVTSNEIRTLMLGLKPVEDAKADELVNSNMPQEKQETPQEPEEDSEESERNSQNGSS